MLFSSNSFRELAVALLVGVLVSVPSFADDWPGWMGADRDGVYRETGIVESISEDGLKVKWRTPIAGGYAGPAVADGKVFVFDYVKEAGESINDPGIRPELTGIERLSAFDESTGERIWTHQYDCPYNISYPAGPRCTPTIHGDHVYILGAEGDLRCLKADDGELVWQKNFKQDFGAEVPLWGFAAHPLVDGDLLYTMVGGFQQCVVAFDRLTGDVAWQALSDEAGYCPLSIIKAGGQRQLIAYHPTGVTSLNPEDGSEYWAVPIQPDYQMSIARPMVDGELMYASGIKSAAVMIKLDSEKPFAEELWRGKPKTALFSGNATPLFVDGVLYGSDGMVGSLIAVDSTDGERIWSTFEPIRPDEKRMLKHGTAFVTRIGETDRYFLFGETGDLMMARMTREKFESLGRFHVLEPTESAFGRSVVWSHPAYANRTAYFRNDQELVAVDLSVRE